MGCATSMVKYIIFIFNLLFAIAGLVLLVIGVIFRINYNSYADSDIKMKFVVVPTVIIVIGAIVFLIAFFGCCGAIRESTCMLTTYAIILLTLFILQVAIGVYAFIQIKGDQASAREEVRTDLWKMMRGYNTSKEAQEATDGLQSSLQCCGVNGPPDWNEIWHNNQVPRSCCIEGHPNCTPYADVYKPGCADALWEFFLKVGKIIGIVVIVIAATELGGAVIALCLASSIRNHERRGNYA